jgi:hypothetical protein
MDPRAALDDMEKIKDVTLLGIERQPSSPQPVAAPTELFRIFSCLGGVT